jgi:vancomycin permeability regulator SanA
MNKRSKPSELPTYIELKKIMSLESKRLPNNKNGYIYQGDNSFLLKLLEYFKLDYSWLNFEISSSNYMHISEEIKNLLIEKILLNNYEDNLIQQFDEIYDYLSEEDEAIPAQNAFVFGSSSTLRIQKAIELYNKNIINKITISGHKPFYKDTSTTEAEEIEKFAIQNGIHQNDIEIETKGLTIPDNVKRTLDLWHEKRFYPTNLIIITSPFAMRRCFIDWKKFLDFNCQIIRQNSESSENFKKNNWYKEKNTLNIFINELVKIMGEHLIDLELKKELLNNN